MQLDKYDVDAQMEDGNTALHLAASNGFGEVCYTLHKQFNAKIDLQNHDENVVSRRILGLRCGIYFPKIRNLRSLDHGLLIHQI